MRVLDTEEKHDGGDDEPAEPEKLRNRLEERQERIDELEGELAERQGRVDELESRVKRVQADFQNYKKRAEERREEVRERATEDLVERLLGVRDDIDRALEADEETDADGEDLREGVEIIRDELDDVLRDEGVERVETDEFDPEKHEAMMRVDSEEHEEGEVVDVYEQGYVMAGRVLRPAKVTVADGDEGEDE
ncbi:nucleotide exchange factor GrpE [Haladaptatus sp. F3-133]|uniref:Protein GrpE n=1 Tax=Halorutilus salinus TaxID=2487751 RepID=A0A9Q4C3K7_9EURY|nr:nucleotide exchange factor GrpE [Halorutilus salinus]